MFGGPIPQPQIFPGVFLTDINAAVQLDPTLVRGGAGVDVGKVAHINGAFLVAFATPSQPYRLTTQDAGGEFPPLAGTLFKSTTIAVGGDVIIKDVPVYGDLRMGNAAAMYSYPDFFAFAGGVRIPVPGMSIEGGVNGWSQVGARKFEAAGHVNACIAGLKPFCIGAEGMVGSRGMSACGSFAGLHPGGGLLWGHWPTVWPIDGCKPSRFWEVFTAKASADRVTFKVARGEKVKQLKIPGTGGAPDIKITAPGGEVLSTAGTTYARTAHMVALRQDGGEVTWAGVKDGRPGTYTIERLPGSVPIGRLGQTRPGYDTDFTARVTGKGAVRTLHYDARRKAGQTVTFVERGGVESKILRTVHGGRGSFRFRPAPGGATARRIVALASIDGAPIPEQTARPLHRRAHPQDRQAGPGQAHPPGNLADRPLDEGNRRHALRDHAQGRQRQVADVHGRRQPPLVRAQERPADLRRHGLGQRPGRVRRLGQAAQCDVQAAQAALHGTADELAQREEGEVAFRDVSRWGPSAA